MKTKIIIKDKVTWAYISAFCLLLLVFYSWYKELHWISIVVGAFFLVVIVWANKN